MADQIVRWILFIFIWTFTLLAAAPLIDFWLNGFTGIKVQNGRSLWTKSVYINGNAKWIFAVVYVIITGFLLRIAIGVTLSLFG